MAVHQAPAVPQSDFVSQLALEDNADYSRPGQYCSPLLYMSTSHAHHSSEQQGLPQPQRLGRVKREYGNCQLTGYFYPELKPANTQGSTPSVPVLWEELVNTLAGGCRGQAAVRKPGGRHREESG